ncbi:MAG: ABC transporter ATP-binding protein [Saprospiraceae bacterium]|nr:ABC transporter ATP-binding protein [Saprospiraceae bacterium]
MQAVISAKNIIKTFDLGEVKVHALRGVDLEIYEGDFVAIMGHSGSGKSTFMNIIGCLDVPTSGEVYIDDNDVANYDRDNLATIRNKKIGFVFQSYNLLSRTTALENVELPLIYNPNISAGKREELSKKALEKVGLADRLLHLTNQLSGGQQQRVAIARALVNEPLVILADEPTGNLDTRTSYEIMDIFQELNDAGKTIVIVTHEGDIAKMCKRNIVFKDGKVIKDFMVENPINAKEELAKMPKQEDALA